MATNVRACGRGIHLRRVKAFWLTVLLLGLAGSAAAQSGGAWSNIAEYPLPSAFCGPNGITVGPDGALWFTEYDGNKIGRITKAGVVTEYRLPIASSDPSGIAAGPDAALWFTEATRNKIGRITTAGVITEFPVPTASKLGSRPT